MPTIAWVLLWAVVLAVLVFFLVRERRAGRKQPAEFDRMKHQAAAEADMNLQARGPSTTGLGGN